MKWIREILAKGRMAAFASGLLLLYAIVLFLSPDPAWTLWAAQVAIGVLYVPDAPGLHGLAPGEIMRTMSAVGALGSFVVAALLALRIKRHESAHRKTFPSASPKRGIDEHVPFPGSEITDNHRT